MKSKRFKKLGLFLYLNVRSMAANTFMVLTVAWIIGTKLPELLFRKIFTSVTTD
jgi:hypothetical protein